MIKESFIYYKKGIISILPYKLQNTIDKEDRFFLFKKFGGLYIRTISDFDNHNEESKYWCVIQDKDYNISELSSTTRNQIRRCLKECSIRKIDVSEIINNEGGYDIYQSEIDRFKSKGYDVSRTKDRWKNGLLEASKNGQEFFGVFNNNIIIAYAATKVNDDEVDYTTWKANYKEYNKLYPTYGLVYYMNSYYLNERKMSFCNDGERSLTEHSNVQNFLIDKFKFRRAYCNLNVYFKWYVLIIIIMLSPFEKLIKNNRILSIIRMYRYSR